MNSRPFIEAPPEIKRRLKAVFLVWLALTICSALLGLMAGVARVERSTEGPMAAAMFLTMAGVMLVSSLVLQFYALSETRLKTFASQRLQGLESARAWSLLFRHWMMISFVVWSLNESIASLGLVISSVAEDLPGVAGWMAALGVALNLLSYPRFEKAARRAGLLRAA